MKNKYLYKQSGFTLIELLIVMAIMVFFLTILLQTVISLTSTSSQSVSRAEANQEITGTQQWIAAQLKEAIYILPAGQTLTFNLTDSDSSKMITQQTGGSSWVTGNNFLAYIAPPIKPSTECSSAVTDGCFILKAIYLQPRAFWLTQTGGATPTLQSPGNTASNNNELVIASLQAPLITSTLFADKTATVNICLASTTPTDCANNNKDILQTSLLPALKTVTTGKVRFLLDHVHQDTKFTYDISQLWLPKSPMFGPGYNYLGLNYVAPYVLQANIQLALQATRTIRVPPTGTQDIGISPRNLGQATVPPKVLP